MKQQKNIVKTNFFKKSFIKFCRYLNYEIIDQSNFYVPTQEKKLNDNLNIPGKKSITLPLGVTTITRKVNALTIVFRSCTNVNMLTQSKKRLFDKNKSEYTFRSLNSIIRSTNNAKKNSKIKINIIVIDANSKKEDVNKIKEILNNSNSNYSIINLNINEFSNSIKKVNAINKKVTDNQLSNMSNIHKSLLIAKEKCEDLIYFVEDDYLHEKNSISEMIFTYERISSQLNRELVLCPTDYPFLYNKIDSTKIFLGAGKHWRQIDETLCTFLTSKSLLIKHWNKFVSMCQFEHYPFEQPLHDIYKSEYCFSPIPSLALHCTNVNSVFGLSPNMNWEKVWIESENY